MTNWIQNGGPVDTIAISDRGLLYGDGVFETIAIRRGEPRLWSYHLDRLTRSCKILELAMPAELDLLNGIELAIASSGVSSEYAVVKIMITAGTSERGYGRRYVAAPTVLFGGFVSAPPSAEAYIKGVRTILCETRLASGSVFSGLKTLNRLEQVRARSEVIQNGAYEGLTMDADTNIICGTMSNVFFVHNNQITTSPLARCGVAGVMRSHVIAALQERGMHVAFDDMKLADLGDVDEVFLSNSQFGVMPVSECDSRRWPVGELTRTVMTILGDSGIDECRL